ncbi:unnamed protein product [Cyclocybe aegerita]|uniref:Glycoside hydrolase family 5 domain-containing protein n=1 Tax=Cyclocybe aegerita TaxID=1973307 RepID=A0A8S0VSN1_CYCAE|nr:unnamed protein product [Cyclocybe aegerita]
MWNVSLLAHTLLFALVSPVFSSGPLHTSGRWILDPNQQRVKLRCVNWAGHMEVNIPEGLHRQPIDTIAAWIASNNFNCVRLTYSIDMALNPTQSVRDAFTAAASPAGVRQAAMQALYTQAVGRNPFLASATTREVFGRVIDALGSRGVHVVLDNHVSRASWCCGLTDGNGWWDQASGYNAENSRYFDTNKWLAGLSAMASFARSHPAVVGMALRNELRTSQQQVPGEDSAWRRFVTQGASAVHAANNDLLIVIGGVGYATDLRTLYSNPLDTSPWDGANRTVWEFHAYSWSFSNSGSCSVASTRYGDYAGFLLAQNRPYTGPLWLSEFGVGMTGGPSANQGLSNADYNYLRCLVQYLEGNDAEWAVWALQGSYYVRNQVVDYDESFGLLTRDWSAWRNPAFPGMLGGMWRVTQGP